MLIVSGWGLPRENVSGTLIPKKGMSSDGAGLCRRRCAIGCDRWWAVRAYARAWLPSTLQSRRCVHPVGVTNEGLPSRVMSELAPITLGRDELTSDHFRYHARCSRFFCFVIFGTKSQVAVSNIMLAAHVFTPAPLLITEIRWIAQSGVRA